MGAAVVNTKLNDWQNRLSHRSRAALLMLVEGGHSRKAIARKTGVAEPNVSRLRTTYETLSGTRLRRLKLNAPMTPTLAAA